jgi:hypothetical protein
MTRIRRTLRSVAARINRGLDLPDLFAVAGVAVFAYGLALINDAAPWLWVGGYLLLVARGATTRRSA